jgi:hypothetical protein
MSVTRKVFSLVMLAALSGPVTGCVVYTRPRPGVVYVAERPPVARVEVIPAAPGVGFVWIRDIGAIAETVTRGWLAAGSVRPRATGCGLRSGGSTTGMGGTWSPATGADRSEGRRARRTTARGKGEERIGEERRATGEVTVSSLLTHRSLPIAPHPCSSL